MAVQITRQPLEVKCIGKGLQHTTATQPHTHTHTHTSSMRQCRSLCNINATRTCLQLRTRRRQAPVRLGRIGLGLDDQVFANAESHLANQTKRTPELVARCHRCNSNSGCESAW